MVFILVCDSDCFPPSLSALADHLRPQAGPYRLTPPGGLAKPPGGR